MVRAIYNIVAIWNSYRETLHHKQNTQQNFFELVPKLFLPPFIAEKSISSVKIIATPSRHQFPNAQDKGYDATSVHVKYEKVHTYLQTGHSCLGHFQSPFGFIIFFC